MKVAATRPDTYPSRRNSLGELLEGEPHEQFLWGGAGNGLSFDSGTPRQSLTRQLFFRALKQSLRVKTFGLNRYAVGGGAAVASA